MCNRIGYFVVAVSCGFAASIPQTVSPASAQERQRSMDMLAQTGRDQTEALKIHDRIYQANGFGNTFMVLTDDGNVIIDTSIPFLAPRHVQLLRKVSTAPVRHIILTHSHPDHNGGIRLWKEEGTKVVAQRQYPATQQYHDMLAGFYSGRNAAQFGLSPVATGTFALFQRGQIHPDLLVDDQYVFEQGGVRFELFSTPGETYDHLTIWLPELRAVFVGDNVYDSFPNIYTLRGTKPRWAMDYVRAIDKVRGLKPEYLLLSHGQPVVGAEQVEKFLKKSRDAIVYVHDATVAGMNQGKDVYTLMREIKLPPELDVGEAYGRVSWSVRGIYEGYVGWFDGEAASMFHLPPSSIHGELVAMAGGSEQVAKKSGELLKKGEPIRALHLANAALGADPQSPSALSARLAALTALHDQSDNFIEQRWLQSFMRETEGRLQETAAK